ncbi:hypothetical protein B0H14DRAFT_3454423 [Mycena olivaceomarginata]|nr:hypothetical protein B0H14DRAFT_3454423 [Mycena olivaceomarginata]
MDVYELHVPWLQIVGGAGVREGVADHFDGLPTRKQETTIVRNTLIGFRKALPWLPSVDDVYFDLDDSVSEDGGGNESDTTTPTMPKHHPHLIAGLPPSVPTTLQIQLSTVVPTGDSLKLLASLRQHFQAAKQALYATTPVGTLNDVWCMFMITANSAEK